MSILIHKNHTFTMDKRIEIPSDACVARWEDVEGEVGYRNLVIDIPALGPLAEEANMKMSDFEGANLKIQVTHKPGKILPPVPDMIVAKFDDVKEQTEEGYQFTVRVKEESAGPDVLVNVSLVNPQTRMRLMSAEHLVVINHEVVKQQSSGSFVSLVDDNSLKTNFRVDAKVNKQPTVRVGTIQNGFLGKAFIRNNPAIKSLVIREIVRVGCDVMISTDLDNDGDFSERSEWMKKFWNTMVQTSSVLTARYVESFNDGVENSIAANTEDRMDWVSDMVEAFEIKNKLNKVVLELASEANQ